MTFHGVTLALAAADFADVVGLGVLSLAELVPLGALEHGAQIRTPASGGHKLYGQLGIRDPRGGVRH